MKKKLVIVLSVLSVIIVIIALVLSINIKKLEEGKVEIIDATYACSSVPEKFYEDNEYAYYFTCSKSESMFVKFSNGNKMLIKKALEEKKVTIDELIKAGLNVYKEEI